MTQISLKPILLPEQYQDLQSVFDGLQREILKPIEDGTHSVTTETVTSTPHTVSTQRLVLVDDDTIGGAVVVNLPAAAVSDGVEYIIKKLGTTGNVTITPYGAETIDGSASLVISTQYSSYTLNCDGTEWWIV